ncbi:MAG: sensor domain-containing diguanylate cyclase [Methylococcales bacterium]|nr:sensor domain-containing diguanylate cyclase [Methylococcales bacterium]
MEEDITTDLCVLQSHLDGMLDRVQYNSLTLKRFQVFEMKLLNLNSLAEMIELLLVDAKAFFDLDAISFCLIDEKSEISGFLDDDGFDYQNRKGIFFMEDKKLLKKIFGSTLRPFLGDYKPSKCEGLFPDLKNKPQSVAIIPLNRRGQYLGSLNMGSYAPNRFINEMATDFIEHMVAVVSICLENILNFETMRRTSLIDTLTGVNNRRFLEQRIGEELDRSQRYDEPLSCLFLDIDHFKQTNDTYGHQAGDYVLALVAGMIKKQLRSNDVLARYGGEEFVALLSNITESKAYDIAERIRLSIKGLAIDYNDKNINVTISIGLATYQPSGSVTKSTAEISTELIHSADEALYSAKQNGRNRVAKGEPVFDTEIQAKIA